MRNNWTVYLVRILLILVILFLLVQVSPVLEWVLRLFKLVAIPFLLSLIIAYILYPVVQMLHRRKVPRAVAVLLIYGAFMLLASILTVRFSPVVWRQFWDIAEHLPQWSASLQAWLNQLYTENQTYLPGGLHQAFIEAIAKGQYYVTQKLTDWIHSFPSMLENLIIFLTVPFVTFYLLKDFDVMERAFIRLFPTHNRKELVRLFSDINQALGNYIRGQMVVALLIALLSFIGYQVIGLPYALFLAIFVGIFDIVPYIGPYLGAVPALLVALTVEPSLVLKVAIVNIIVQLIEGNVLSPPIVGKTLRMHPLTIIFVVLVGGKIGGLLGSLLAVPFTAVLKVVFHHWTLYVIRRRSHPQEKQEKG